MTQPVLKDEILIRRPPKKAVILFHGFGDNAAGMKMFAQSFAPLFPSDVGFFCPNAPEPVSFFPDGFQWFPLADADFDNENQTPEDKIKRLFSFVSHKERLLGMIVPYLDKVKNDYGLAADDLVLSGFSQGGFVSLMLGAALFPKPAGIVSFSGVPYLDQTLSSMPPTLLIHGDADDTVPLASLKVEEAFLDNKNISYHSVIIPFMGHEILTPAAQAAADFIKKCLKI